MAIRRTPFRPDYHPLFNDNDEINNSAIEKFNGRKCSKKNQSNQVNKGMNGGRRRRRRGEREGEGGGRRREKYIYKRVTIETDGLDGWVYK